MSLLGQLFLYPEREQTIAELQQATGIPQQTVSREVGRLLTAGVLSGRRVGRLHFVKPNEASPYFPELAGLLLKAFGPRPVLAEGLAGLAGVEEAYMFGSWARRYEAEPGPPPGDIDAVVIGQPDVDAVYEACREASAILGQEVNPVVLTPAEWRSDRSAFVQELRKGTLVALTGS
jgi:predicted nucleotidyltransferase